MCPASAKWSSYKMASYPVVHIVDQHCIIRFIMKEKVKPEEILHSLNAQNGEETLSYANVCDCYCKFSEGRKEVWNLLHAHIQPAAVCDINIHHIEELIL
jgi:hypothetical protein